MKIYGQCSCGTVKFKFNVKGPFAYQCHCSICRKATGSAYSTTLMAPEQNFVWSEGSEMVSSYSRENGYKVNFCSCCGSPVPNKFRDLPLYSVPLGSLDNEPVINVVVQIYLGSKAKWEKEQLEGQQYVEMPSLDEMLEYLHVRGQP